MGKCKFCGQKAGLFKSVHKDCVHAHDTGKVTIVNEVSKAILGTTDFSTFETEINSIAQNAFIAKEELYQLFGLGFDNAVEEFLDNGVVSPEEEEKIAKFKNHFNLDESTLDVRGSLQKIVKSLVIRDVIEGKIPSRLIITEALPFLLAKGENVIWLFPNVEFHEQRIKTTYVGRSQGVSVKIAKGLYYRTGGFKGNPVTSEQMTLLGTGTLALTNKNLFFGSSTKTIKTPYNKLISLAPYTDGIGLQKDGASAKPQIFKGLDGWFSYNLISNLSKI